LEWEVGGDGTFMVIGTTYPWCTSIWCSTNIYISGAPRGHAPQICLPPFPEDGAPLISSICVAHPKFMRHGCGGLTPQALVLVWAHICVAHPFFDTPRIRRYLWSIYLGVPRLLICGVSKRSAPQIIGPWIRVFLVVTELRGTAREAVDQHMRRLGQGSDAPR
jgi:hypothetical protein